MMMLASESRSISNAWHNRLADPIHEIDMLIRENSAKGKFKVIYPNEEITKAYGTNTLNQKHNRILYEIKKRNYNIEFDCENGNLIISW